MKITLSTDDVAVLEKCCLRIMDQTSDMAELAALAELLSMVRSWRNSGADT